MRQRLVNEKAAAKMQAFLTSVYAKCMTGQKFTFSELYKTHGVSKATGAALSKLEIIGERDGKYFWRKATANREMTLQVLEVLRLRNDKMVSMPLEGFESLVDTLQQLVISLKPKSESRNDIRYKETLNRDETFVKLVASISTGVYKEAFKHIQNPSDTAWIGSTNDFIIAASKDLLTKIYK